MAKQGLVYKAVKPERITPPPKPMVKKEAKKLPAGGPKAAVPGRILSEAAQAKKQGARRAKP